MSGSLTQKDARQVISRDLLSQLFPGLPNQKLDELLRSIDGDLTWLLRLDASAPIDRVVHIGPATSANSETFRNRSIPHILSTIPSFAGGTLTFPSASGGSISASPGSSQVLTLPSNQYVKVTIALDSSGNIDFVIGTPDAVEANALVPPPNSNTLPIGFVSIHNAFGTIANIPQTKITQFPAGTGASSSSTGFLRTENPQVGTSYTFGLADGSGAGGNPYVSFSNPSAVNVTVPANTSVAFPVGTEISAISNGDGDVKLVPDTGVTLKSLKNYTKLTGKYAEATLIKRATDTWYLYGELSSTFIVATGGVITTDGNFKVHTFNSSGTFQILSGEGIVDSLVIAGGGGGASNPDGGGGGGAGGFTYTTPGNLYMVGSFPVTVGAGGAGGPTGLSGSTGGNSVFDPSGANIVTLGGGFGERDGIGGNGGSGGGGGGATTNPGGTGTVGQGHNGGTATGAGSNGGGGGGGAGAAGGNAAGGGAAGSGGVGLSNSITGSAVLYAGGGGGCSSNGSEGAGGLGGGGAGIGSANGTDGTPNTGGGGGAGADSGSFRGGNGGSGVVILRYQFQ